MRARSRRAGGDIVFSVSSRRCSAAKGSLTGAYLQRNETIPLPEKRRQPDPAFSASTHRGYCQQPARSRCHGASGHVRRHQRRERFRQEHAGASGASILRCWRRSTCNRRKARQGPPGVNCAEPILSQKSFALISRHCRARRAPMPRFTSALTIPSAIFRRHGRGAFSGLHRGRFFLQWWHGPMPPLQRLRRGKNRNAISCRCLRDLSHLRGPSFPGAAAAGSIPGP